MRKSPYLVSLLFLLAATILTLLSIYMPDLIHVVQITPGPLNFETKYGLYRRCTRVLPQSQAIGVRPANTKYLLERASPKDTSIPANLNRLVMLSASTGSAVGLGMESEIMAGMSGIGDIDSPLDPDGEGWKCQAFPSQSECRQFGQTFCIVWATAGFAAQLSLVPCLISLIALLFITLARGKKEKRAARRKGGWRIVSALMSLHAVAQIVSTACVIHEYRTDERFRSGASLDTAADLGVASALVSIAMVLTLTLTGLAAEAGQPWAGGKSVRYPKRRRHRRTRSGRVVMVAPDEPISETTGLLSESEEAAFASASTGVDVNGASAATGEGGNVVKSGDVV